ncbi:DEAD/DEAH box helicase [Thalassotalea ponticola]|uniref:DEAD/DEAH box helicase n=1 Tax=Thalassotalea ponticola TaxID=1523392 RepID=UPI0025B56366|nr:DEAD/DEAH box helicase [Thalassotalea ponticola]MDN3653250.1 DEAD/DEAH box helicase [Thalassotalea ponticola]
MSFDTIGLPEPLLAAVKECGYKNMTKVQQRAIPAVRSGQDVLVSAETGTGKTAAFSLPIIEHLLTAKASSVPVVKALILTPTRELAQQVAENITNYCRHTHLKTVVVYGGAGMAKQEKKLKEGADILVATPGRLLEHVQLRHVNLSQVKHLVLDEADRMLDMGFLTDIQTLLATLKHQYQTCLFSATFSNKVKTLTKQILHNPRVIETAKQNATNTKIRHFVYPVQEQRKSEMLAELIGVNNWQQVMVFAGTRDSANQIAKELKLDGIKTVLCHGEKSQGARNKALQDFVEGRARVMVATDVAARGIDIPDLQFVVNYHLPFLPEDYVHRIGRTGRAGKTGTAISLLSPKDNKFLANIEKTIGQKITKVQLPGYQFDATANEASAPADNAKTGKNRYQAQQLKNRAVSKKTPAKTSKKATKPKKRSRYSSK